jgi:hypothetical protein
MRMFYHRPFVRIEPACLDFPADVNGITSYADTIVGKLRYKINIIPWLN